MGGSAEEEAAGGCAAMILGALLVGVSALSGVIEGVVWHTTEDVMVTSKDAVTGQRQVYALTIAGEKPRAYVVEDSVLLDFHWNSADTYGMLIPGRQYRVRSRGIRWGFMSWFPNLVEATPIAPAAPVSTKKAPAPPPSSVPGGPVVDVRITPAQGSGP